MPKGLIKAASEPDEVRAPLPGFDINITVHQRARYASSIAVLQLDRMALMSAEDNVARTARLHLPEGLMAISVLPGATAAILGGGAEFTPDKVNQHCAGRQYYQTVFAPTLTSAIFIPPEQLRQAAATLNVSLPNIDTNNLMKPSTARLHRLMRLHTAAMTIVRETPHIIDHGEAMRGLEHAVLGAVLACMENSDAQSTRPSVLRHGAVVRAFDDMLAADPESNILVSDVCARLRISPRMLRYCCERQMGLSPKRFLLLRRMHLVRRRLIDAPPGSITVTDAATAYGFWELGRFAGAYRSLFGETPSATLRRNQGMAPGPAGDPILLRPGWLTGGASADWAEAGSRLLSGTMPAASTTSRE